MSFVATVPARPSSHPSAELLCMFNSRHPSCLWQQSRGRAGAAHFAVVRFVVELSVLGTKAASS